YTVFFAYRLAYDHTYDHDSHAFPTRRSSDLWSSRVCFRNTGRKSQHPNSNGEAEKFRSEEHTSELQSRFDLVCRLLLEKKKRRHNVNGEGAVNTTMHELSRRRETQKYTMERS